ncbi:hypothetical protein [Brevibacillus parabrevis]|uniref:Uncharacterized protein n=1 Tax=Brevibacillus parabrevis TaxID=54914 RepID=A0A4Y3PPA1_BREPA|nr:hypothetical protein [Brevibacillus parabrevis]RNB93764.1 hypothetical protein EDM60_19745 [Brevibacillus parabrevis]GEB33188.1 hypothetical protein BPA01_27680 [Brevibacillus parabrevis]
MEIAKIVEGLWGSKWSPSMDLEPDNMCETFLLEHSHLVADRFPENSFYLDRFPLQIKDQSAFEKVNIFFDKTVDDPNLLSLYLREEEKFKQVLRKLWVYNSVWIETALPSVNEEIVVDTINSDTQKIRAKEIHSQLKASGSNSMKLANLHDFEILVELGLREKVSTVFIFENMKICVWSNFDFSLPVYSKDEKYTQLLHRICTTEGIFLRPLND